MKYKTACTAGLAGIATTAAFGSVRLLNPTPNPDKTASVIFDWEIMASTGPTEWIEEDGGYVEVGGADDADIEDEPCGCPEGYSAPCYRRAIADSARWSYL